jgi:hypothetical protein
VSTGTSGSASGYLTALFRAGTLSDKSDSELLEQFIAGRSGQEQQDNNHYLLKLGRPGRLVGIVRSDSGQPLHDVPVMVWVRASGTKPGGAGMARARRRATPTEIVDYASELDPPRTGLQGAFQTPPTIRGGSTYRMSIRRDGYAPFVSEKSAGKFCGGRCERNYRLRTDRFRRRSGFSLTLG